MSTSGSVPPEDRWIVAAQAQVCQVENLIEGAGRVPGGQLIEKEGPRDGQLLYQFGCGNQDDVDEAVRSAARAFAAGRWSKLGSDSRKGILLSLASLIERHREELALLEALDVGKPISDALSFDVPGAAAIIRFCAEAADKVYTNVYGADSTSIAYQLRRPIGVVGGIVGWNFPLVLAASKAGPALATGNSLILKPSELTSLSTRRLAELALEAGVPPGVFNVIHGSAGVGAALARHGDVNLITFTGSTQTGKKLLVASGESNMKRVLLECGGKAPNIVFADSSDLGAIADAVVARAFWNQGEVCTASSRLLVQESIKDELLERLSETVSRLLPGDPLDPSTRFGALVSRAHRAKVLGYIGSGEREGARVAYRMQSMSPVEGGFYLGPVIFAEVRPEQTIAREEIFGPVLSVSTFRDEQHAIDLANCTPYGLSAIVWTRDVSRAQRLTRALQSGWIVVNATDQPMSTLSETALCIGGLKQSGIGAEGGIEGLEAYTTKTVVQWFT